MVDERHPFERIWDETGVDDHARKTSRDKCDLCGQPVGEHPCPEHRSAAQYAENRVPPPDVF